MGSLVFWPTASDAAHPFMSLRARAGRWQPGVGAFRRAALGDLCLWRRWGASAAWSLSVLTPCLVSDVIKTEERGRVLGWLHLVWNGAMLVGSLIGGALFAWRAGAPFLVTAAMNLGTIALAVAFFSEKKRDRICGKKRTRQDLQDQTG